MYRVHGRNMSLHIKRVVGVFLVVSIGFLLITISILHKNRTRSITEAPANVSIFSASESGAIPDVPEKLEVEESKILIPHYEQYVQFSMAIAQGWTVTRDHKNNYPVILLSNNIHTIEISQQTTQKQICPFEMDRGNQLHSSVDIVGITHTYRRRIAKDNIDRYTVCELNDGNYVSPTSYGTISYITSKQPSDTALLEMDLMIASIK